MDKMNTTEGASMDKMYSTEVLVGEEHQQGRGYEIINEWAKEEWFHEIGDLSQFFK
jgi:hypothetical protein